jgi:hypothetical protein
MRKVVLACGLTEAISVFGYGLSILISGTIDHSNVGSPLVQFIIYSLFGAALAAIVRGLSLGQNWARTPFYLIQIFVAIAGYTLISGDGSTVKAIGIVVGAIGIIGFISLLKSPDA